MDGVDLEVNEGEALGVLGPNGAGKTTLIKLLAGYLSASSGGVARRGATEAIIDLGGGLNQFLSGRENAIIGARSRGFSGHKAREYVGDVEGFADIGEAFDDAVCTYSSGMQIRVGFAIAAAARPDILLVDEALAVGDHLFQRKCIQFIRDMLSRGGSLVFVSHNANQVQTLCQKAILLEDGRLVFTGSSSDTVREMLDRARLESKEFKGSERLGHLRLVSFQSGSGGVPTTGERAELIAEYLLDRDHEDVSWGFEIWTADEQICVTSAQDMRRRSLSKGRGQLRCTIDRLPLVDGNYLLKLNLSDLVIVEPIAATRNGSEMVSVRSAPNLISNFHVQRGQLTIIDVNWG